MNKHPIDIAFGERMKEIRLKRGLSQTDLARHCGITFQQIQKYETGCNRCSISRLYQISEVLGVAPHKMVKGLGK